MIDDDQYSEAETARRRDAVVRTMANTAPQPKASPQARPKKKKKADADRKARDQGKS